MAIKKSSKKKAAKKAVASIESVLETVASQSATSPACKAAVVNYNAAMRSLAAVNKKVIAFTGRFEKSLANVDKAKTPKQKELAKSRLADSRTARSMVVAEAREKTKAANDAEKILRALAALYTASLAKFQKDFVRNAAARQKALTPRVTKKKTARKKAAKKKVSQ
jgi:adenylate kinase/ribonuclease R